MFFEYLSEISKIEICAAPVIHDPRYRDEFFMNAATKNLNGEQEAMTI